MSNKVFFLRDSLKSVKWLKKNIAKNTHTHIIAHLVALADN